MEMWRQLPRETKIYYHRLAKSWRTRIANKKAQLAETKNVMNQGR